MESKTHELKSTLTGQRFGTVDNYEHLIDVTKAHAVSFAKITEGIAVLSDFSKGVCHTYSGKFGRQVFGLEEYSVNENSPFEDEIFNGTLKEDLLERHILELRFFNFIHTIPKEQQTEFQMSCIIRFSRPDGATLPVLHTSRYIQWDSEGNAWLGLCTYIPLSIIDIKDERGIINAVTGETVDETIYTKNDCKILSRRQREVLSLLAKGDGASRLPTN